MEKVSGHGRRIKREGIGYRVSDGGRESIEKQITKQREVGREEERCLCFNHSSRSPYHTLMNGLSTHKEAVCVCV